MLMKLVRTYKVFEFFNSKNVSSTYLESIIFIFLNMPQYIICSSLDLHKNNIKMLLKYC